MVEDKIDKSFGYTIGHLRRKYLDQANNLYTRGGKENISMCKRALDNFIETIKEDSEAANMLKQKKEMIHEVRVKRLVELEPFKKNADYLMKEDIKDEERLIEEDAVHDLKIACWDVAQANGLFYER